MCYERDCAVGGHTDCQATEKDQAVRRYSMRAIGDAPPGFDETVEGGGSLGGDGGTVGGAEAGDFFEGRFVWWCAVWLGTWGGWGLSW